MSIWNVTFAMYEKLRASKLNSMMAAINAHAHGTLYYTKGEVDGLDMTKVKATSVDPTADYLDGKVDNTTVKVTSNQLTVGNVFGAWQNVSASSGGPMTTDGILHVQCYDTNAYLQGFTDSGNPATVIRVVTPSTAGYNIGGLTMAVRKGDYWKLGGGSSYTVYWLPIGS